MEQADDFSLEPKKSYSVKFGVSQIKQADCSFSRSEPSTTELPSSLNG